VRGRCAWWKTFCRLAIDAKIVAVKGEHLTVTVEIPDDLAGALAAGGQDPERAVLEAIALEGYRTERLSESAVRRLLGFESRMQVHGFLKANHVYLHYGLEDLEHDMREADRIVGLLTASDSADLRAR
jgi:hypothetical protein